MENKNVEILTSFSFAGGCPVDAATAPINQYTELFKIGERYRYEGMQVVGKQLTNRTPCHIIYTLRNNIDDNSWKITHVDPLLNYSKLQVLPDLWTLYTVGLEVTIIADETNFGKTTKYWVTSATSNGVTWGRLENHNSEGGINVSLSGNDLA